MMNSKNIFATGFFVLAVVVACTSTSKYESMDSSDRLPAAVNNALEKLRGSLAEYDAGPPKDSQWPDLFAETPNYRAYGKALYQIAAQKSGIRDDGSEKFRWKVGPMWYRGRLTPNNVKVFVIGQEGAQDENTSNRTFTGSTGTKMQNFINYFGIDRSYLFMNTFIYTITGQYGERPEPTDSAQVKKEKEVHSNTLYWLAQNPDSAIVKHRHRMFDYMLNQNKDILRLVIGVGSAGKDSLATWIRSHGGQCTPKQLSSSYCDASSLSPGVVAIGVMHPGAASQRNGGADAASSLHAQFAKRAEVVAQLIQKKQNWLTPDPGMRPNFSKPYFYADAPIPHRDFPFGANFRLGKEGTTTNRRGADGIQIYSDGGCYNNAVRINGKCDFSPKPKTLNVLYDEPTDVKSTLKMATGDLPWESPKSKEGRRQYDEGPGEFASVLLGDVNSVWPDFTALGVTAHASYGAGPIYRGHLKNPEVLIVADQESHDDLFSARALTGTGGQRLQTFLGLMGLSENYAILRTLPVDTLDLSVDKVKEIALNKDVAAARTRAFEAILKQNKTKLVLTVGPVAAEIMKQLHPGTPVVNLESSLSAQHISQWQKSLGEITQLGLGFKVSGKYSGELTAIPRADLPAHTRWWMGTSGSRASRAYLIQNKVKQWNGDYYQFNAPNWVNNKNYPANPQELFGDVKTSLQSFEKANIEHGADSTESDQ